MANDKVAAVIVAAGKSKRMGDSDKIFAKLCGKPLLFYAVDAFHKCDAIDEIVIVLNQNNLDKGKRMIFDCGWNKVVHICIGGTRRQDSVKNGIDCLSDCHWVLIHDGARPCVSQKIILDGLKAAEMTGAAIPSIQVGDTAKYVSSDMFVEKTLPREVVHLIQTPQVFRFDIISEAYRDSSDDVTDDASLVERLGYGIRVFAGSSANIKVTTPIDLIIGEAILKSGVLD